LYGHIKQSSFIDNFLRNLQLNTTGLYQDQYPYLSCSGIHNNFVQATISPIVFTSLVDKQWLYGRSLSLPFFPSDLAVVDTTKGTLLHHKITLNQGNEPITILGLLHRSVAEQLFVNIDYDAVQDTITFSWEGQEYLVGSYPEPPAPCQLPQDVFYAQRRTKWWNEEE